MFGMCMSEKAAEQKELKKRRAELAERRGQERERQRRLDIIKERASLDREQELDDGRNIHAVSRQRQASLGTSTMSQQRRFSSRPPPLLHVMGGDNHSQPNPPRSRSISPPTNQDDTTKLDQSLVLDLMRRDAMARRASLSTSTKPPDSSIRPTAQPKMAKAVVPPKKRRLPKPWHVVATLVVCFVGVMLVYDVPLSLEGLGTLLPTTSQTATPVAQTPLVEDIVVDAPPPTIITASDDSTTSQLSDVTYLVWSDFVRCWNHLLSKIASSQPLAMDVSPLPDKHLDETPLRDEEEEATNTIDGEGDKEGEAVDDSAPPSNTIPSNAEEVGTDVVEDIPGVITNEELPEMEEEVDTTPPTEDTVVPDVVAEDTPVATPTEDTVVPDVVAEDTPVATPTEDALLEETEDMPPDVPSSIPHREEAPHHPSTSHPMWETVTSLFRYGAVNVALAAVAAFGIGRYGGRLAATETDYEDQVGGQVDASLVDHGASVLGLTPTSHPPVKEYNPTPKGSSSNTTPERNDSTRGDEPVGVSVSAEREVVKGHHAREVSTPNPAAISLQYASSSPTAFLDDFVVADRVVSSPESSRASTVLNRNSSMQQTYESSSQIRGTQTASDTTPTVMSEREECIVERMDRLANELGSLGDQALRRRLETDIVQVDRYSDLTGELRGAVSALSSQLERIKNERSARRLASTQLRRPSSTGSVIQKPMRFRTATPRPLVVGEVDSDKDDHTTTKANTEPHTVSPTIEDDDEASRLREALILENRKKHEAMAQLEISAVTEEEVPSEEDTSTPPNGHVGDASLGLTPPPPTASNTLDDGVWF